MWLGISTVKKVQQSHYRPGVAPESSRKLRFPDFMTTTQDGGKVVILTHFCQGLSQSQGHSVNGRIMSLKNSNDIIGNRTHDLPVCSVVP